MMEKKTATIGCRVSIKVSGLAHHLHDIPLAISLQGLTSTRSRVRWGRVVILPLLVYCVSFGWVPFAEKEGETKRASKN